MTDLRIALLTDINEAIHPGSLSGESVFAYELVRSLKESAESIGAISLTLFARRHSSAGIPTVSLDPSEFGMAENKLDAYAFQEALYVQLVLSGMLDGYQLIHSLAPIASPLLLLAQKGLPIIQTLVAGPEHPASRLCTKIPGMKMQQVHIGPYQISDAYAAIPPSVDLQEFYPHAKAEDDFIFWLGKTGEPSAILAEQIASDLKLPLRTAESGDPKELIRHARLLLHLPDSPSATESVWPLRALACGTAVAGWYSENLEKILFKPELGFFTKPGETEKLREGVQLIPNREIAGALRREFVLALYGRRAMAARYRDLYKTFFKEL